MKKWVFVGSFIFVYSCGVPMNKLATTCFEKYPCLPKDSIQYIEIEKEVLLTGDTIYRKIPCPDGVKFVTDTLYIPEKIIQTKVNTERVFMQDSALIQAYNELRLKYEQAIIDISKAQLELNLIKGKKNKSLDGVAYILLIICVLLSLCCLVLVFRRK